MDTLKIGSLITIEQFSKIRFVIAERRQGGMGAVYRLIPVNPDLSEYALKVVLGEGQVVDLAEREAQMWVSLGEYPGLARALWAGKWEGQPAILSHWYPRSADSITPDEWTYDSLVDFTVLLLEALSYANVRFGLVHRDIKPSNILVDAEMVPRLTDFGVSLMAPVDKAITQLDPLSSRTIRKCVTVSGIAGTPRYMAPELFAGYLPSIKSDIYALGVSLYEILTLEHPILDNAGHWRTAESQRRCLSRAFARITRARYDVLLESIIACISIDPSSRPTYSELLSKLPKSKSTMDRTGQRVALDSFHPNAPSIVSYATTLRNQGNPDQARGVLASALNSTPNDPLILNSMAVLELRTGNREYAISLLKTAAEQLVSQNGFYSQGVYCDPVVNLSRQMIGKGIFMEASMWLRKAYEWLRKQSPQQIPFYPEFAWLFLYERKPNQALTHLLSYERYNDCDECALEWLILAAILENRVVDIADIFCRQASKLSTLCERVAIAVYWLVNYITGIDRYGLKGRVMIEHGPVIHRLLSSIRFDVSQSATYVSGNLMLLIAEAIDDSGIGGSNNEAIKSMAEMRDRKGKQHS